MYNTIHQRAAIWALATYQRPGDAYELDRKLIGSGGHQSIAVTALVEE
jgi:hypothetical protein